MNAESSSVKKETMEEEKLYIKDEPPPEDEDR